MSLHSSVLSKDDSSGGEKGPAVANSSEVDAIMVDSDPEG